MKSFSLIKLGLASLLIPLTALAQTTTGSSRSSGDYDASPGAWEFTFGGNGASNKDFDDSFGGLNVSAGYYLQNASVVVLRQSVNYANPNNAGTAWNGSTRIAFDQHILPRGIVRPFVGLNFGGVYGDSVNDTWAAGLEGGAKFYIVPRTFIYAMAEYDWFFRQARNLTDRFSDGQWNWSIGVGFHF
jgi:hypothetical protein